MFKEQGVRTIFIGENISRYDTVFPEGFGRRGKSVQQRRAVSSGA